VKFFACVAFVPKAHINSDALGGKPLFHFNAICAPNGIYDRSMAQSISTIPAIALRLSVPKLALHSPASTAQPARKVSLYT